MYTIKTEPFFLGYEILDPADFSDFFYPASKSLPKLSGSGLKYYPPDSATPGYPASPRMQLSRVYLQEGVFIDYWTNLHEPSLSERMRALITQHAKDGLPSSDIYAKLSDVIPEDARALFPQLLVSSSWPPTFIMHGDKDSAVHADESRHMLALLHKAGVPATLRVVDGEEHSFDYRPGAVDKYGKEGGLYDEVAAFLKDNLLS
jgi:acetyl esterase/lipase